MEGKSRRGRKGKGRGVAGIFKIFFLETLQEKKQENE